MKLFQFLVLFVLICSCTKKDCSTIDLKTLPDIKMAVNVPAQAGTFDDLLREMDKYVHRTHKLIIRCRSENDLQRDKVLPGVMLWMSDTWALRSDTSKIGRLFYEHGIGSWERTRVLSIMFHRHLNDQDPAIPGLMADARVNSEYKGRVQSGAMLKMFGENDKKALLAQIKKTDSLLLTVSMREISLTERQGAKNNTNAVIVNKRVIMNRLEKIHVDVLENRSAMADIDSVQDVNIQKSLVGFAGLKIAQKLQLLEELKIKILLAEDTTLKSAQRNQ